VEAPVDVQTAHLDEVLHRTADPLATARITATPDDGWLSLWTALVRRGNPVLVKQRVLDRIAPPSGYALLERNGDPVAVGHGVVERGWLGIFSMATAAGARRQGAATAVLHALARWASGLGASHCYLQVEAENVPAHRLYEGSGFVTFYQYHYRTGPNGSTSSRVAGTRGIAH
jgi:GNAT superfamily N-acetyltransferase